MKTIAKLTALTLVLVFTLLLAACASETRLQGTITEDGSLNVQPLAEKLASSFTDKYPRVEITIKGSSTAAGIEAVNSGAVDIGGASRDLKPPEPKLVTHLLARDGVAIIVNPANHLGNLTKAQIRDIFSGKITTWREVGGADLPVHIITREAATSTRTVLEEALMGGEPISAAAEVRTDNPSQKAAVQQDPAAIGYNPFATSLDGSVKAISIDNVGATRETARNGSYPLIRPLYFLTKQAPVGLVKSYIDYCLGEDGQSIVAGLGYVPVK